MMLEYNLPGLSRAGSIKSGLLVAPITKTTAVLLIPSNSANNCETTLKNYNFSFFITHKEVNMIIRITDP